MPRSSKATMNNASKGGEEGREQKEESENNNVDRDHEEDKLIEDTLDSLYGLVMKKQKALEDRTMELDKAIQAFEKEKAIFGATPDDGKTKDGDVLYLNIGGETVVNVLRRTLTQVEGSLLASMFSGRWDDNMTKDKEGNFFIDQPADLFVPLVNTSAPRITRRRQGRQSSRLARIPTSTEMKRSIAIFCEWSNVSYVLFQVQLEQCSQDTRSYLPCSDRVARPSRF